MSLEQIIFDPNITGYKDEHNIIGNIALDKDANVITSGDGSSDDLATSFNAHDMRAFGYAFDGTNWDRLRATNGALHVDIQDAAINVDLDHADDSVRLGDGTTLFTGTTVGPDTGLDVFVLNSSFDVNLQAGDGTDITQTGGALDVNIASSSGLGIYAEDAVAADGALGQQILAVRQDSLVASTSADGDYGWFKQTNLGELYVKHVDDINIADGGNSITVDAVDLDIRDLSAATDSVESWMKDGNGDDIQAYNADLRVADIINNLANSNLTNVGTGAGAGPGAQNIVASAQANRKWAWLFNNSKKLMYIGASGITAATGFPMPPKAMYEFRLGAAAVMQVLGTDAADGQDFRLMEGSA